MPARHYSRSLRLDSFRPSFSCATSRDHDQHHPGCLGGEPLRRTEEWSDNTCEVLTHRVRLDSVHPSPVPPHGIMTNVIQVAWVANHFGALKSGRTTPVKC
jgi:hypothetical protein